MDKQNELDHQIQEITKQLDAQHVTLFFAYLAEIPSVVVKLPQLWMIFERLFIMDPGIRTGKGPEIRYTNA